MSIEQKPRRKESQIAKIVMDDATHNYHKKIDAHCGRSYISPEAEQTKELMELIEAPLENYQVDGMGAGGELKFNLPVERGDYETAMLRDTVKEPTMITAAAQFERARLAKDAGVIEMALDAADTIKPKNSLEKMLAHQLSALHTLSMRMAGATGVWLDDAKYASGSDKQMIMVEAARGATATAKMMQAFQQGITTLNRIRAGGKQQVTVIHQHVQVAGGNVAVAGVTK